MSQRPESPGPASLGFVEVLIGIVGGVSIMVWAGAQLAALIGHGQPLEVTVGQALEAAVRLPENMSDPRMAWPAPARHQLPGPVLYWAASMLAAVAAGGVGWAGWRLFRGPREALDRRTRLGVPAQGRLAKRGELRPLLTRRPEPGRFVLGRVRRHLLATELPPTGRTRRRSTGRGAVALIGASRSGKTTAAIGGILEWQGPAVLCSLRSDLLGATGQWRADCGDVQVYDPCGVTGRESGSWSPLQGAQTVSGAIQAARAMAEAAPREHQPGQQGAFWTQMAESLLSALLVLAANSEKRTFSDVVRWVVSTDMPAEGYVGEVPSLLRALKNESDPARKEAAKFAAQVLEGLWRNDHRTVSSVYATARTMVWPWVDPKVAKVTSSCTINLDWLLAGSNTLYVCMPLNKEDGLRPVLGGVLNDLIGQAFERHVRTNKPLDPPLLLVIDEAATLCPDRLPAWSATLAGVGIQLVTTWQSVGQIEAAYGRHSEGILTNHVTKVFYAGMSDPAGLDYASRLLGEEHLPAALSQQGRPDWERSSVATVPVVPAAALRQMRPGDALLVHGTLPPAHVRLRPWYRDRRLKGRAGR